MGEYLLNKFRKTKWKIENGKLKIEESASQAI